MKNLFYHVYTAWTGKNHVNTPINTIMTQLQEKRELPVGLAAFHEWSDRIISGAALPATTETQKYTLANMLINLNPTTAYEQDIYFIHSLKKSAVNQVADYYRKSVYAAKQARMAEELAAKKLAEEKLAEVTPPMESDGKVLEVGGFSDPKQEVEEKT